MEAPSMMILARDPQSDASEDIRASTRRTSEDVRVHGGPRTASCRASDIERPHTMRRAEYFPRGGRALCAVTTSRHQAHLACVVWPFNESYPDRSCLGLHWSGETSAGARVSGHNKEER